MERILTLNDALALARVIETVIQTSKVVRVDPDTGAHIHGIARSLVKSEQDFSSRDFKADVRDSYLRVTLRIGFEVAWPVAALMIESDEGNFVAYDWS